MESQAFSAPGRPLSDSINHLVCAHLPPHRHLVTIKNKKGDYYNNLSLFKPFFVQKKSHESIHFFIGVQYCVMNCFLYYFLVNHQCSTSVFVHF